jgi:hypothetical protein
MGPSSNVTTFLMGRAEAVLVMIFSALLAALMSSADASPSLVLPLRRGKRMRRFLYSWRRSTLALRPSSERLARRGSTEIPMVRANLRGIPAAAALLVRSSSARVVVCTLQLNERETTAGPDAAVVCIGNQQLSPQQSSVSTYT